MKIDDLTFTKTELETIADKILKQQEEPIGEGDNHIGSEVYVIGNDMDDRLSKELLIKIQYTHAPLSKSLRVKRFWGHRVLIDINGMNENGKRKTKKEIKDIIVEGLYEYIDIASTVPYGHIDIDSMTKR